jgi:hypothetical protein
MPDQLDQPEPTLSITVIRIFFRPLPPGVAYVWDRGGEFACLQLSSDLDRGEQVRCVAEALDLLQAPKGPGYRETIEAPRAAPLRVVV